MFQDSLHLAAALLGNDYIPSQVFDRVFSNIKLVNKRKDTNERHRRIRSLLTYLATRPTSPATEVALLVMLLTYLPTAVQGAGTVAVLLSRDGARHAAQCGNAVAGDLQRGGQLQAGQPPVLLSARHRPASLVLGRVPRSPPPRLAAGHPS